MSRIIKVTANDDYSSLKDIERLRNIRIEDKTIFW